MSEKPISRREAAKADRRRRIVQAARDLIKETGETGLSMRAIAARADVSLATPYNLFGSKRAIIMALLDDVREFRERFTSLDRSSPLDRIFDALHLSMSYHVKDPDFYRTIWASILDTDSTAEQRMELLPPENEEFWRELLIDAQSEGVLAGDLSIDYVQRELGHVFAACMLAWIFGVCQVDELEARIGYGFSLILTAAASDAWQARARERILDFQSRLEAGARKQA